MHDKKHSIPRALVAALRVSFLRVSFLQGASMLMVSMLMVSLLGGCATSPHAAPIRLCRCYESPPSTERFERKDGTIDTWQQIRYLSLRDDWTCALTYGNGAYPIGRWRLVTTWDGSRVVLVWPVGPQTLGDPTPPGDFLHFVVVQHDGHVALQRDGELWTSR